jgi:hypothetical protein
MKQKIFFLILCFLISNHLAATSVAIVYDTPGHFLYSGGFSSAPTDPNDSMFILAANNLVIDLGGNVFNQDPSTLGVRGFKCFTIEPGLQNVTIQNGLIEGFTGTGIFINDGCNQIFLNNITSAFCTDAGIACMGTTSGIENINILNCTVNDVLSSNSGASYGITCSNVSRVNIQGCIIEINGTIPTTTAVGIFLENATGFELISCQALQQTATQLAAGIICQNCTIGILNNCLVCSSSTLGGSDVAAGFFLDACSRIFLKECASTLNFASSGTCYAYVAQNGQRNNFNNCLAQSNIGFAGACGVHLLNETKTAIQNCLVRETTALTGTADGIKLANGSLNCYINANTVLDTSGTFSFGIVDVTNPSTSVFIQNNCFNNGTNYSVNYANGVTLPTVTGSLSANPPGLPAHTGGLLDNVSINP